MRVWTILRHELRMQVSSTRFRLLLLSGMLLAAVAATIGARDFAFRDDQYQQRLLERQDARTSGPKLFGRTVEPTLRILRPPQRMSVLVRGLDAVLPPYWDVSPAGVVEGPTDPSIAQDSEVGEVFDLESVFRIVLGLMALMLGVDSVAGQRASGTLHALMLQPISRWVVVTCKCLAGAIALFSATVLVTVTGLAVLYAATRSIDLGMIRVVSVIDGVAWVYLVSLFGIGLAVGARARTSERAAFTAIGIWVSVTLVAPQLVAFGVRAIVTMPPRQSFERARQNIYDSLLRKTEIVLGREVAGFTGVDLAKRLNDKDVLTRIDTLWRAGAADARFIIRTDEASYAADVERQRRLTRWLARVSPGSLLIELCTDLAGTGRRAQTRWQTSVEAYQDQLDAALFDDRPQLVLRPVADSGNLIESIRKHAPPIYSELPTFNPADSASSGISEERGDLTALLGFVVAGLVLGLVLFPRDGL